MIRRVRELHTHRDCGAGLGIGLALSLPFWLAIAAIVL